MKTNLKLLLTLFHVALHENIDPVKFQEKANWDDVEFEHLMTRKSEMSRLNCERFR